MAACMRSWLLKLKYLVSLINNHRMRRNCEVWIQVLVGRMNDDEASTYKTEENTVLADTIMERWSPHNFKLVPSLRRHAFSILVEIIMFVLSRVQVLLGSLSGAINDVVVAEYICRVKFMRWLLLHKDSRHGHPFELFYYLMYSILGSVWDWMTCWLLLTAEGRGELSTFLPFPREAALGCWLFSALQ